MYILPLLFVTLFPSKIFSKTYEYPIQEEESKTIRTSQINLPSIQEKYTSRRIHGVNNIDFSRPLILSSGGGGRTKASSKKSRKSRKKKEESVLRRREVPKTMKAVSNFEQKLAEQIEEDKMKFVADEKNPLKYVVEKGLLYKQSRFSPIARVEIPPMKTSVFHGNINRQMKAIPVSMNTMSTHPIKKSYPISKDKKCQINRFGFECCDQLLENLMLKSYEKLKRKNEQPDLMTISMIMKQDTKNFFNKNFDVIVGPGDFATSIASNFHCKVELGQNLNLIAFAFVPPLEANIRRRNIPYHELARDDFQETADLVVSRNGIVIAH